MLSIYPGLQDSNLRTTHYILFTGNYRNLIPSSHALILPVHGHTRSRSCCCPSFDLRRVNIHLDLPIDTPTTHPTYTTNPPIHTPLHPFLIIHYPSRTPPSLPPRNMVLLLNTRQVILSSYERFRTSKYRHSVS